jgi:2'-5' RNA ligase
MRLFLAVELPESVRQQLAGLPRTGNPAIKHTPPQNLHVTLKFLGEVEASAVDGLTDTLRQVTVERPAEVWAGHAVLLPPRGPVRVISAGLEGDVARVAALHADIESACAGHGFPPERRAFLPHVTLARPRQPLPASARQPLAELLNAHLPTPVFPARGFTLFESQLGSGPPRYTPLVRFGG